MNSHAILHDQPSACPNCATDASGNYCHGCGQERTLHVPSAREFLHEFVGHYVALEGKLWKSLALLLFRPGRLTLEYLEGKRVRYVQPLRLYLTFSIIFFALFKLGGINVANVDNVDAEDLPRPAAVSAHAADAAGRDSGRDRSHTNIDDNHKLQAWASSVDPRLGAKVGKFLAQPKEEVSHQLSKGFYSYAPYAVFLLMPVFAMWLKLFYLGSGRRYGEHLLFALHTNAFAFLMLSLMLLTPSFLGPALTVSGIWLGLYLPLAMRRVYGGGRLMTLVRWAVLMVLHLTSIGVAIVGAMALAVVI